MSSSPPSPSSSASSSPSSLSSWASSPPSSPRPAILSLVMESDGFGDWCDSHEELRINFNAPMHALIRKRTIVAEEGRWKFDESAKESWDTDLMPPISRKRLLSVDSLQCPIQRKKVDEYLKCAKNNNYFEAPEDRPDVIFEGFYLIYPEGRQDTVFVKHPNFRKFTAFVPKLGPVAVQTHNFLTGSKLRFSKLEKAYLFWPPYNQYYFLTLEAEDESGTFITCKSRVWCGVTEDVWPTFKGLTNRPATAGHGTMVQSFERLPK